MKKRLTHEEHVVEAVKFREAYEALRDQYFRINTRYPKTSAAMRRGWKMLNWLEEYKSALDSEYHKVTTDAQFAKQGHVYYNPIEKA